MMALVTLASANLLALLIFRASTWACLRCFTSYRERVRICQMFGSKYDPELSECEENFTAAFKELLDMKINYEERGRLHDEFTQMIHSLQELATAQGSSKVAFPDAAKKMKEAILDLKEAQACIPPCGVQEAARLFYCRGCYSTVCDFPLDCPVQNVTVNRGDQAMFSCVVGFQLPESEVTYSWKFAGGGLRTQDVNYFQDLPRARGSLARIRPVQPTHSGTFLCVILHDQRPLARLYFFLKVMGPPPLEETELQVHFRKVLRWAPRDTEMVEPWNPSLRELLVAPGALSLENLFLLATIAAVASASATVLLWMFFRWYLSED